MGYVQKYGNNRWRARRRIDGKLVSRSFDDPSEAWAWANSTGPVSSLETGPSGPSELTFREFIESGGFVTAHLRPKTQAFTEDLLRAHLLPYWGDRVLAGITHADVQGWALNEATLSAPRPDGSRRTLSPRTTAHIRKLMVRVMNSVVTAGLRPDNPASGVKSQRVEEAEQRYLTPAEVAALADAIDERFRSWVLVSAYCGTRIGESFGLRWGRVDLFGSAMQIEEVVTEVGGRLSMGPPKTRAGRRRLAIPRSVVLALSDCKRAAGGNVGPSAFVWPGHATGPTRPSAFRNRIWAPAVKAAGLAPLRPHDLRHTAVALWIAAGANPKEVTVRAGHTSVSFCLDRYGHLFPQQDDRLANRLDAMATTHEF